MLVVLEAGSELDRESVLLHLEKHVAKWWLPDDIVVLEELPLGATGKVLKNELRQRFKHYALSED